MSPVEETSDRDPYRRRLAAAPRESPRLRKIRARHGSEFLVQGPPLLVVHRNQVAGDPLEIAVDLFFPDNAFDAVDCGPVAIRRQPRAGGAEQLFELAEAVVKHRRQMCRRAPGLAGGKPIRVKHNDRLSLLLQQVGGRQPGDAGADDANIGLGVLPQRSGRRARRALLRSRPGLFRRDCASSVHSPWQPRDRAA